MSDFEMSKRGMTIGWTVFIKWGWHIFAMLMLLLFGGHVIFNRMDQAKQDRRMERQDERMNKIEKLIEQCFHCKQMRDEPIEEQ